MRLAECKAAAGGLGATKWLGSQANRRNSQVYGSTSQKMQSRLQPRRRARPPQDITEQGIVPLFRRHAPLGRRRHRRTTRHGRIGSAFRGGRLDQAASPTTKGFAPAQQPSRRHPPRRGTRQRGGINPGGTRGDDKVPHREHHHPATPVGSVRRFPQGPGTAGRCPHAAREVSDPTDARQTGRKYNSRRALVAEPLESAAAHRPCSSSDRFRRCLVVRHRADPAN